MPDEYPETAAMLSEQNHKSDTDKKNSKDIDEVSTIHNLDDEIPDFKDSKEFMSENHNVNMTKYTEGLGLETIDEDNEFKFDPSGNFIFTNMPEEDFMTTLSSPKSETITENNYPQALQDSNVRLYEARFHRRYID